MYIIFVYKYWHYDLYQCYFEEDKSSLIHNYLRCCKIPKGFISNSFNININDYVSIVKITSKYQLA